MSPPSQPQEALAPLLAMVVPMAEPFIRSIVAETLAQIKADEVTLGKDRLGYPEAESAALVGVAQHVLRDARRRGEISARLVGKKYVYARSEILRFLADH